MLAQIEIYLIAVLVAVSCSLAGFFLVLRGQSMLADALSHSLILGIALAYFLTRDLNSPLLLLGASGVGLVFAWLVESLSRSGLLKKDAAMGSLFPLFFSLGIVIISQTASNTHLDMDSVLLGELAFAPFNRWIVNGVDLGPKALWTMLVILILNAVFIGLFYKELKLSSFDPAYAAVLGLSPSLIHYGLMAMLSVTAVGAYDSVGAILVVSLMVGPPLAAYLLSNSLKKMLVWALFFALVNSLLGVFLAYRLDVSFAGVIAAVTGVSTALAYLCSPYTSLAGFAGK